MASYFRSLFGGSSSSKKRRASLSEDPKPQRRSHSIPSRLEISPNASSVGHNPTRKRSSSLSYVASPSESYSYASLPAHTNKHGRHSREPRIVSYNYDRPAPYAIYLPTMSSQSNHSRTNSSISSPTPDSSPKTKRTSTSHSSPRPVLKKTSHSNPHTGIQHHVSFANPNRPEVLHMHPVFASSQHYHAPIWYDVTSAPSSKSVIDRKTRTPIPAHTLSQPATDPAKSDKLVLKCNKLSWPVVVHADGRVLTNFDLLCAVHRTLSTRVTHREWEALGHGTHAQLKAARAYEARCKKLGGGWDGGVRRIDWLGEKTCLIGVEVEKTTGIGKLIFGKP
ncbi:uncharacterized protein BT62DRAFT_971659 [Guyanagaster necrorhizus]|uniref:DUF6699 domain-containing protein n=1 Tax=Guyanagaster necrorhizus TaxID=856835 RepID=A0A9P8AQ96_9AGAR|nr:uncharacterized protein BT62DRAFT_971659 [Guyanagaster necrorhizus MCA 3950]KAG7443869.1 hypothetical protein BT62DRAFT_971659 [Guyanagaster necrorhizus MCA 3950]